MSAQRPTSTKAAPARATLPHRVRIIGGRWKRTPLVVPNAEGLRPTPDRVRETLFNWITYLRGGSLEGTSALDLFAGSGALGFECASRGATRVLMVERAAAACQALEEVCARLSAQGIEIRRMDALRAVARCQERGESFDLVFVDPPYHEGWIARLLPAVAGLVGADGLLYIEQESELDHAEVQAHGLEVLRADKAGQVFYHLLRRKADPESAERSPC